MIGHMVPYLLGGGGRNPLTPNPSTPVYRKGALLGTGCDCAGFVAWASGFDRFQRDFPFYGGWINTDSALGIWDAHAQIWHPAKGWFEFLDAPEPGCWICYPSIDIDNDGDRDRIGHVGLVSEVSRPWAWGTTKVVQCSSTHSRLTGGRSVVETNAALWGAAETYRGQKRPRWAGRFIMPLI